jgi:hypothetical protein
MLKKLMPIVILSLVFPAYTQLPAQNHFDGQTWWNYVKVLADDNMQGRETGSEGLRKAEAYVVDQLTKVGLQPAGNDG